MKEKYDPETNSLLITAKELAPVLITEIGPRNVRHYSQLLEAADVQVPPDAAAELQVEELIFLLHLVSRLGHTMLKQEKRDFFMDSIFYEVRELLSRTLNSGMEATSFRETFDVLYNSRQEEYGAYRFGSGEEDSKKGDLFWEHAKSVLFRITSVNVILVAFTEKAGLETFVCLRDLLQRYFDDSHAQVSSK
jgi:hypothetical protein